MSARLGDRNAGCAASPICACSATRPGRESSQRVQRQRGKGAGCSLLRCVPTPGRIAGGADRRDKAMRTPITLRLGQGLLLGLGLLLAACTAPQPRQPVAQAPVAAPAPAKSQSCVDLARISEAQVRDDSVIDFRLRDGGVLRNILPAACPDLGRERAFTYATSLTRLCAADTITVIRQDDGPRLGASCGLGAFVPAPAG